MGEITPEKERHVDNKKGECVDDEGREGDKEDRDALMASQQREPASRRRKELTRPVAFGKTQP